MKDELRDESVDVESVDSPNEATNNNDNTEEPVVELLHAPSEENEPEITLLTAPNIEEEPVAPSTPKVQADGTQVCNEAAKEKMFQKFTSKDFVFLSIMAGCTLLTSAVMPLALSLPIFGIIHLLLGFQMSFFPALGLMKVRKPGALLYMVAVFSLVPIFIMPPVGLGGLLCALITEGLTLLIFRGYKKDAACLFAGTLYFPLGLPLMYGYYQIIYKDGLPQLDADGEPIREAVQAMVNVEPGFAVGISIAVIALCFVAALLGVLTFKKLKKSGAIKK